MIEQRDRDDARDEARAALGLVHLLGQLRMAAAAPTARILDLSVPLDVPPAPGMLRGPLPACRGGPVQACDTMYRLADPPKRVGQTGGPPARLGEGRGDDVPLIEIRSHRSIRARVRDGAISGVCGADGLAPPDRIARAGGGAELRGAEPFASRTGPVDLVLGPADDPAPHDHPGWSVSATRATRSGGFDAAGRAAHASGRSGGPGDRLHESGLDDGARRYRAAHVGAATGRIDRMRRLRGPIQRDRVGCTMAETSAAQTMVEAAAEGGQAGRASNCLAADRPALRLRTYPVWSRLHALDGSHPEPHDVPRHRNTGRAAIAPRRGQARGLACGPDGSQMPSGFAAPGSCARMRP
jgi:hypothetical protein